jgi:hypothetical protein
VVGWSLCATVTEHERIIWAPLVAFFAREFRQQIIFAPFFSFFFSLLDSCLWVVSAPQQLGLKNFMHVVFLCLLIYFRSCFYCRPSILTLRVLASKRR